MSKKPNQRLKLIAIARILNEQTDQMHPMNADQLLHALQGFGIEAERKSIYLDIEALQSFGMDIEMKRGRQGGYYLASRRFELPELKLLVDAVQSSRFITHRKSGQLIRKLEALTSEAQAKELQRQVFVAGRIKTMNESIYYNVDKLHAAIHAGKQIMFRYFEWAIDFQQEQRVVKRYRKCGEDYRVSPWALAWVDGNYYLVAFDAAANKVKHYRVDKMENIRLSRAGRVGQRHFDQFDIGSYAQKTFGMFGGEERQVTLCCENWAIGVLQDRFGCDLMLRPHDDAHFETTVTVAVSPQFFAWIFGLGAAARVLAPADVLEAYRRQLEDVICRL